MSNRLAALESMVAKQPKDPLPYYGLALEYRSANRLQDAINVFQTIREKFPNYVPQYLMAGQILVQLNNKESAKDWFSTGISVAQSNRDAHALGELESALNALTP